MAVDRPCNVTDSEVQQTVVIRNNESAGSPSNNTAINIDTGTGNADGSDSDVPLAGATGTVDLEDSATDSVDGSAEEALRSPRHTCQARRSGRRATAGGVRARGFMVTGLRELQSRHGQWTCFFCCHVTTGTAIIGAWHVLLHVLALSLLSLAVLYPSLVMSAGGAGGARPLNGDYLVIGTHQDVQAVNCTHMPCSLATHHGRDASTAHYPHVAPDFPLALGHLLSTHQLNSEAVSVAVFITLCTLLVTLLLLHGLNKQNPSHLMPFFFLQVFDFCISSMTMVSYLSYLPNLRHLLQETPAFPFRDLLLGMQTNCLTFAVMIIFISTFLVKAYCINIVWRCYKYLLVCRAAAITGQSTASILAAADRSSGGQAANLRFVSSSHGGQTCQHPPADHCMHWLLQGDNRTKVAGAFPEPPPSYDMAMAAPHYSSPPATDDDQAPFLPPYEEALATAAAAVAAAASDSAASPADTSAHTVPLAADRDTFIPRLLASPPTFGGRSLSGYTSSRTDGTTPTTSSTATGSNIVIPSPVVTAANATTTELV